jgi:hypothetical protein
LRVIAVFRSPSVEARLVLARPLEARLVVARLVEARLVFARLVEARLVLEVEGFLAAGMSRSPCRSELEGAAEALSVRRRGGRKGEHTCRDEFRH